MRILIADDDEDGFVPICASLEADGHAVVHALDGEAALECLAIGSFDMGIFDLDMPRRDGVSLVGELRARGVELPIVLVSGNGNVREVARDLAIEHCLLKPFGLDELQLVIAKIAAEGRESASRDDAQAPPSSAGFPATEAATQIRLRYRVPPAASAENDG